MDEAAKKTCLRMIPYGIYVLTAEANGKTAAATVNWVTQTSFAPPLVAVAVKADSAARDIVERAGSFALNMLCKGQQKIAFGFFKTVDRDGDSIGGEPLKVGHTGVPLLKNAAATAECKVSDIVKKGDHHIVIGEVIAANVAREPDGRPDESILEMKELGDNVFYGG